MQQQHEGVVAEKRVWGVACQRRVSGVDGESIAWTIIGKGSERHFERKCCSGHVAHRFTRVFVVVGVATLANNGESRATCKETSVPRFDGLTF